MDASVPENRRVIVQKRALRRYLDSGLTEMVRLDGRQYTRNRNKVMVEAIAAEIEPLEPLEFRRRVEKYMRFDLVPNGPDALFNNIANQQRN